MKKILLMLTISLLSTPLMANDKPLPTTPLQAVLADNPFTESTDLSNIDLTQSLNRVENPNEVTITLIESDLLDDSVAAIKTVYILKNNESSWSIDSKKKSQKCRRGDKQDEFIFERCP